MRNKKHKQPQIRKIREAFEPSNLPDAKFVEIVDIRNFHNGLYEYIQDPNTEANNPIQYALELENSSFLASEKLAKKIMDLFRQLPFSRNARCHNPPYGLVFHANDENIIYVSLCWECNDAKVWFSNTEKDESDFWFDGESKIALELFQLCQECLPLPCFVEERK